MMTLNPVATFHNADKRRRGIFLALSVLLLTTFSLVTLSHRAQAAACAPPATDYGSATSTVKIDNAATYRIWSRIQAPDATNNSYLLEVDGQNCYVVGDSSLTPNTWTWVDYQNGTASSKVDLALSSGDHTIKMIGREAGVQLGRVLFVSDTSCVPTGTGSNCTVVGDTTPPTVNITAPADSASVSANTAITVAASDNVAISKVEFYINGTLASTSTTSPYSYTWNTTTTANGQASLMVKAYDAAGNTTSDTRQVKVANGVPTDTQAPTTPTGVTAIANAYNKVTVNWTASTDNTGVKGYWVARNGVTVGNVTVGTQFVDTTVSPAITYSYQVTAYDAAGNTSAISATAKATTPTVPDTQAPTAPVSLQAAAVGTSQVNVSWTAATDNIGVAAYDVFRALGAGTPAKVATVTTLSYGDTGLAASTSYSYYVVARDSAGNVSPQSVIATAKTQTPEPTTKTGTIKGHITYSKKQWWNRALVSLQVDGHTKSYVVNAKGDYTINKLPAGTYKVKFSTFGGRTQKVTVKVQAGKTTTQNITLRSN